MSYCCSKCIKLTECKIIAYYDTCDCIITDDDYYSTLNTDCWCDDSDWTCSDCQQISYSKYKVESEQITIQCKVCHEITKSCCLAGYHKIL